MQFGNPLTLAGQQFVAGPTTVAISGSFGQTTITPPAGSRTLILRLLPNTFPGVPISVVGIIGATSGMDYYSLANRFAQGGSHPPYLQANTPPSPFIIFCPISTVLDSSFAIQLTTDASVSGVIVTAWADTTVVPESTFYNGRVFAIQTSIAVIGSANIIKGPIRLLTASLSSAGGVSIMQISGSTFLQSVAPNIETVTMPPNTIVPLGGTVDISQGLSNSSCIGSITYAYP